MRSGRVAALLLLLAAAGSAAGEQDPTPLRRIAVSDLRPVVGGEVSLELPWSGGWPAELRWTGVDQALGNRATLRTRQVGPLVVEAAGLRVTLQVQPAANAGAPPAPEWKGAVSLPWVDGPCADPRYPALAGSWAVGCGTRALDRAQDLLTGQQVELTGAGEQAALAPGLVFGTHGAWWLPEASPVRDGLLVRDQAIAPPATDGVRAAFTTAEGLRTFDLDGNTLQHLVAHPAPWYRPAISGEWVAWVDDGDPLTREDIWLRGPGMLEGAPLTRSEGYQRHPAASGRWLGWIDDEAVVVEDLETGERRRYPADAHTSRGLSLWGPVACWEQWNGVDVDVACSDGLVVQEPGHQRAPSRYGPWLVYSDDEVLKLITARALVLDDDDPRAEPLGERVAGEQALRGAWVPAGVRYRVELPGSWRVQRWEEGAWGAAEPFDGELTATDAIRLSPAPG